MGGKGLGGQRQWEDEGGGGGEGRDWKKGKGDIHKRRLGNTLTAAATWAPHGLAPEGCSAYFCTMRIQVSELHIHTAVQEPLAGGRGRTKERKKYLPLNWQKLELLNVGEMQGNHSGNLPLALTMAPWQGAIIFMEHMIPDLESKASRQGVGSHRVSVGFPQGSKCKAQSWAQRLWCEWSSRARQPYQATENYQAEPHGLTWCVWH